ncbi:hypothetical protein CAI21_08010 [Alkalilimnicola ehrlichii]|nr:hypothetical protein CAI21_08010 [Alkalilimnicola ehrlichii]
MRLEADTAQQGTENQPPRSTEDTWEERYRAFAQEKAAILNAGLSETDQEEQLTRLLETHYQAHERDAARAYARYRKQQARNAP